MNKKSIIIFILILFLPILNINAYSIDDKVEYECTNNYDYDNLCFYKLNQFSRNGKIWGDYSEEIVENMLLTALPVRLKYDENRTFLRTEYDGILDHEFLENIDGKPIMKNMEILSSTGEPSGNYNNFFEYYNYILPDSILKGCPEKIYQEVFVENHEVIGDFYFNYWYIDENAFEKPKKGFLDVEYIYEYKLIKDCKEHVEDDPIVIDCSYLIDDNLRKYIDEVVNIICIGVPIILLCFIVYDLVKSIFNGTDDEINKTKKRIAIRIIIAIVIFFVPTFVDFILDLVNNIWATKFDTCL